MSGTAYERLRKILAFAAVVEIATGLALIVDPALVIRLLVGATAPIEDAPLGRFPGIAILALGVACWPGRQDAEMGSPAAFRAMLLYNVLTALFLVYLFTVSHLGGVLLWPGAVLHAVVASLLIWTGRRARQNTLGIQ